VNLDDNYTPRKVRISGDPDAISGYKLRVSDAQTGEEILNVVSALVRLDATSYNQVELTYHPLNERGQVIVGESGEAVTQTCTTQAELALTALSHMTLAEAVAQCFHSTYERLAPEFGYETRKASSVPWKDVPDNNKRLMIAVASEVLQALNFHGVNEENDG
jgi:hypothetical protein